MKASISRRSAGLAFARTLLSAGLVLSDGARAQPLPDTAADSTAGRLGLPSLERLVLERNPELRSAERSWVASRERIPQAGALDDPKADLMVAPASIGDLDVDPAWRIGLSQQLTLGKRSPQRAAAGSDAESARGALRATAERILHETRLAFADYALAETSLAINRELAGLAEDQRRTALARYGAGLVGQADPLQAELELGRLAHDAIIHGRERGLARARLNALLGRSPDEPLAASDWRDAPDHLEAAVARFVEASPPGRGSRLQARAMVEGAEARLRLAQRARRPDLEISVAYDRFWSEPELRPTLGISLNLPLQRGVLAAAEREARAELESARHQQAATEYGIALEVESARLRLEETRHEIELFEETMVPVSRRALDAARSGYQTGRNDVAAWIGSAREVATTRLAAFRARADQLRAQADLLRALGDAGDIGAVLDSGESPFGPDTLGKEQP
jgi:cobalt-zinc-cadmium efflux system outer membrane protein